MGDFEENLSKQNEENTEDESIITMVDVLEEEKKLEEDAYAVLGASDDANCTYNRGYVNRQALYACKTCFDKNKNLAGICLACSYHCHEGHDLVELYTKRNFRCDCGNSLFGDKECSLQMEKDVKNIGNSYNQNFRGIYCTCARPYPDPDDSTMDEMIQCIVCEDWYHTRHLIGSTVPSIDDYSEMICHFCTDRLSSFLRYYKDYSVTKIKSDPSGDNDKNIVVDVAERGMTTEDAKMSQQQDISLNTMPLMSVDSVDMLKVKMDKNVTHDGETSSEIALPAAVGSAENNILSSNKKSDDDFQDCKLKSMSFEKLASDDFSGASFWREGFRSVLCRCKSCLDLYKSHGVYFLIDLLDTVQAYEEEGEMRRNRSRTGPGSGYEEGLKALSSLDRMKQVEAIHSYNEMQQHLKTYLAKFAENKKVVRAEDIKEFFNEMQSRKRQKVEVPYFCH